MTRREFLEAALALTVAGNVHAAGAGRAVRSTEIPRRRLWRTGAEVSILGVGGAHLLAIGTEAEAVRLIREAIDGGITFLDNCWDYGEGEAERRMGKALRDGYRDRAFLMTKIDGRDKKTAARQLDESLQRLGTDRLDLLQLHEVIHENDSERTFAKGGAIEALIEAKKAGKTRFLGFTGHKSPALHLEMLEAAKAHGFRFDAVQLPLNVLDAHYDSFEKKVLPVLMKEEIGVLGMKPMADHFILDEKLASAPDCLRYALSLPVSVVITGMDSRGRLQQALDVGRGFRPLSEAEVDALLAKTAGRAKGGELEKYKTSHHFDGTVKHPEWLG